MEPNLNTKFGNDSASISPVDHLIVIWYDKDRTLKGKKKNKTKGSRTKESVIVIKEQVEAQCYFLSASGGEQSALP